MAIEMLEGNMNVEEVTTLATNNFANPMQRSRMNPELVLEELFCLLEEYCPTWYTEELHNKAIAALIERNW